LLKEEPPEGSQKDAREEHSPTRNAQGRCKKLAERKERALMNIGKELFKGEESLKGGNRIMKGKKNPG